MNTVDSRLFLIEGSEGFNYHYKDGEFYNPFTHRFMGYIVRADKVLLAELDAKGNLFVNNENVPIDDCTFVFGKSQKAFAKEQLPSFLEEKKWINMEEKIEQLEQSNRNLVRSSKDLRNLLEKTLDILLKLDETDNRIRGAYQIFRSKNDILEIKKQINAMWEKTPSSGVFYKFSSTFYEKHTSYYNMKNVHMHIFLISNRNRCFFLI